ncbi:MAG: alpha/beta fold hydrolase [Planctomycetaceae bacterium]
MPFSTNRRQFLASCAAGSAFALSPSVFGAVPKVHVKTFTYKRVGELAIKADLHRADDDKKRPVVVWIHGGALIMGHRAGISRRMKPLLLNAGYAILSIDYRLAPETKLPGIVSDVEDAFTWLHKKGEKLLNVDTSRVAVMGGSAGGHLTLTAGFRAKPRPTVLVPFWGYGDLVGDWLSKPSPHKRHHRVKISKANAWKQVSGPPISDSRNRNGNGGVFYQYCRQHGSWPKAVSGWDPHTEVKKFVPYMAVRNVTKTYPPTLLIHGTKDTDVPYEQSVIMAKQFKKHGVEHKLISIEGGEHGLGGGNPKKIAAAYRAALAFVNRHMKAD